MMDLDPLIPAGSSLRLLDAYAIDASGKIVGSAFDEDNQVRAFLLTLNGAAAWNTAAAVSPEHNASDGAVH